MQTFPIPNLLARRFYWKPIHGVELLAIFGETP